MIKLTDQPQQPTDPLQPVTPQPAAPDPPTSTLAQPVAPARSRKPVFIALAALVVLLLAGGAWLFSRSNAADGTTAKPATVSPAANAAQKTAPAVAAKTFDLRKNYGDKYAAGRLPVGDNKYTTDGPKTGYIYVCQANFVPASQAGAQVRGPWFITNNTEWDMNKKAKIAGHVSWQQAITTKIVDGKRVVTTNGLPNHYTGVFPVAASDPARVYDANPNTIKSQSLTYTLDAAPSAMGANCMGGESGVMTTGVALFNGFDAGGRDAGAWEVQDGCDGHPQGSGLYHYHTLSRCITSADVKTVIGYALDGYPITGPKIADGNILTTQDLDECHGITSAVTIDGTPTTTYHYVMTQDFSYSISCFRGTAIKSPAQHSGAGSASPQGPPPGQYGQPPRQ
jgi:hypothetical protein